MYVVMTKWVEVARPFGTTREPAFHASGVTSYRDITGQSAGDIARDGYLVCEVEADPSVIADIESQGLGVVLDGGVGEKTKLETYGLADVSDTSVITLKQKIIGRQLIRIDEALLQEIEG